MRAAVTSATPGGGEGGEVGGGEPPALAQPQVAGGQRMREHRPLGLGERERAEAHQGRLSGRRSRSVSWARIATAISAGELAPMSAPIGAWMRAKAAASRPAARRRSRRFAWVRGEPRLPR